MFPPPLLDAGDDQELHAFQQSPRHTDDQGHEGRRRVRVPRLPPRPRQSRSRRRRRQGPRPRSRSWTGRIRWRRRWGGRTTRRSPSKSRQESVEVEVSRQRTQGKRPLPLTGVQRRPLPMPQRPMELPVQPRVPEVPEPNTHGDLLQEGLGAAGTGGFHPAGAPSALTPTTGGPCRGGILQPLAGPGPHTGHECHAQTRRGSSTDVTSEG